MIEIQKYIDDVAKYTSNVDEELVTYVTKRLASILGDRDSSLVSCSDNSELDTVKKNFLSSKLGVEGDEADTAIKSVCEKMSGDRTKSRVTFYYLLIEATGKKDTYMN